jgi:hypothetical protein
MMSEELRSIDANGHVPAPYGQAPAAITDPVADEFERIARCRECGLLTLHAWDCRTGQLVKDVSALLWAAEVLDRRWPDGVSELRVRAEELSREIP